MMGSYPYTESKSKDKDQDAIVAFAYASYSHLYQPNTRTYLTWSVTESYGQNNSLIGLRTANLQKIQNTYRNLNTNFNLSYFRFFSPRLSINAGINANVYTNLTTNRNEVTYTPTNLFNFKSTNNYIRGGIGISAGLNYALF